MIYLDTGVELCPFYTKFDASDDRSILCRCNGDGSFSYGITSLLNEFPNSSFKTSYEYYNKTYAGHTAYDSTIFDTSFNCKMWDFDNNRCGMKISDFIKQPTTEEKCFMTQLENTLGKTSERDSANSIIEYFKSVIGEIVEKDSDKSLITYLKNILGNNQEKSSAEGTGSSLLKELNHMHGAHWHPSPHECVQIPVGCGCSNVGFPSFGTPYATVLIAEYMSSQDLDDNGFIYGKEFMIADGYDKPLMLKPIEVTPEWEDPPIVIEWQPILEWSKSIPPNKLPDPLDPYR